MGIQSPEPNEKQLNPESPISPKKILVIDDHEMVVNTNGMVLQMLGYNATTLWKEVEVDELLEKVKEGDFDAALLDGRLWGGRTSEDIAIKLKELGIPSVVLTGESKERITWGDAYISKTTRGDKIDVIASEMERVLKEKGDESMQG